MFGDIEMNDTATVVAKDVVCMIIEKAPPSMGRWGTMANHILGEPLESAQNPGYFAPQG